MFAYIPARIGSKRIPKKNIKLLGGKPLICNVIEELLKVADLKGIAVSTDSEEIVEVLSAYSKVVTLELRSSQLSNDTATFMDLVRHDLARYCEHFSSKEVVFTLPTSALVKDTYYAEGIKKFREAPQGALVMAVTEYSDSPFLSLVKKGEYISPLFPEKYLLPTVKLDVCFKDSGCFYIFNKSEVADLEKFIDLSPILPLVLPNDVGIDLDTSKDWEKLESVFHSRMS